MRKTPLSAITLAAALVLPAAGPAQAQEAPVVEVKRMSMELARDIAENALKSCRERGYQVSAVVLDRSGDPQAILRDVYAPRMTLEIAREKAGAVILAGTSSASLDANRADIASDLNHLDEVLTMAGGLPIESGGSLLGSVAVSGAPSGKIDEECAQAGLDSVSQQLQFGGL
jgi:uncharacterized protein GlcG (DUF336 family)